MGGMGGQYYGASRLLGTVAEILDDAVVAAVQAYNIRYEQNTRLQ